MTSCTAPVPHTAPAGSCCCCHHSLHTLWGLVQAACYSWPSASRRGCSAFNASLFRPSSLQPRQAWGTTTAASPNWLLQAHYAPHGMPQRNVTVCGDNLLTATVHVHVTDIYHPASSPPSSDSLFPSTPSSPSLSASSLSQSFILVPPVDVGRITITIGYTTCAPATCGSRLGSVCLVFAPCWAALLGCCCTLRFKLHGTLKAAGGNAVGQSGMASVHEDPCACSPCSSMLCA